MRKGRSIALDVRYNNAPFAGQIGADIESLTYVDSAADNSDSIDITLDAQDGKWLRGWMPNKGATLSPRIIGRDWDSTGDTRAIHCGLFVLNDISFSDAPTTLQIGGVSKPSNKLNKKRPVVKRFLRQQHLLKLSTQLYTSTTHCIIDACKLQFVCLIGGWVFNPRQQHVAYSR